MSRVLARKYRPRQFAEVVGQDHVVRALQHGILHDRLHHAYLLTGTRGVGKTTLARILAKAGNCEFLHKHQPPQSAEPCGQCEHCLAIEQGSFADLVEIDAASNTGVDAMRTLLDTVAYPPYRGKRKMYVIDEVHMLSTSAFNAMLKTLEEPPPHLTFVLATTDPQKVPITILSRCLQFNLKPIPENLLVEHFEKILKLEGIAFDLQALPLIAHAADGSVRDGLSLIDQLLAQGDGALNANIVQSILGLVGRDFTWGLLEKILKYQTQDLVLMAEALEAQSMAFHEVLAELSRAILALHVVQMGGISPEGIEGERLKALLPLTTPEALQLMYQMLLQAQRDLPYAPDPKTGFMMTLLRIMAFMPAPEVSTPPQELMPLSNQITPASTTLPPITRITADNSSKTPAPNLSNNAPIARQGSSKIEVTPPHYGQVDLAHPVDGALALKPWTPESAPQKGLTRVPSPLEGKAESSNTLSQGSEATGGDWGFLQGIDWATLIADMRLSAPLRRISIFSAPYQCQMVKSEADEEHILTLALFYEEKHLLATSVTGLFMQALQTYFFKRFQKKVVVQFRVTELPPACIAAINQTQHQALVKHAHQALLQNPLWQVLHQEFGATLLEENLRILPQQQD